MNLYFHNRLVGEAPKNTFLPDQSHWTSSLNKGHLDSGKIVDVEEKTSVGPRMITNLFDEEIRAPPLPLPLPPPMPRERSREPRRRGRSVGDRELDRFKRTPGIRSAWRVIDRRKQSPDVIRELMEWTNTSNTSNAKQFWGSSYLDKYPKRNVFVGIPMKSLVHCKLTVPQVAIRIASFNDKFPLYELWL